MRIYESYANLRIANKPRAEPHMLLANIRSRAGTVSSVARRAQARTSERDALGERVRERKYVRSAIQVMVFVFVPSAGLPQSAARIFGDFPPNHENYLPLPLTCWRRFCQKLQPLPVCRGLLNTRQAA